MMQTLLHLAGMMIGLGALAIGAGALVFPEKSSGGFGVKVKHQDSAYVRVSGARDLFIGCIFFFFSLRSEWHLLAYICFFTAGVSFCDFWITRAYGSKFIANFHLAATVAVLIYGYLIF